MSFTKFLLSLSFATLILAQNGSPEDSGVAPPASSPRPTTPANGVNNEAGASGASSGYNLSKGGIIAIIVVCIVAAALGIGSAVLFYIAKKRQWEVRKTIKRASRRVVSKVNPRQSRQSTRPKGMVRMRSPSGRGDVDLEKGKVQKASVKPEDKTDRKSKRQAMQINDSETAAPPPGKYKTVLPDSWTVGGKK